MHVSSAHGLKPRCNTVVLRVATLVTFSAGSTKFKPSCEALSCLGLSHSMGFQEGSSVLLPELKLPYTEVAAARNGSTHCELFLPLPAKKVYTLNSAIRSLV